MLKSFEKYLLLEKRYSINTITAYIKDIKQFYKFINKSENNIILNSELVRNWIAYLLENNLNKKTVNRKISSLKTFYKFLIRENKIDKNPLDKISAPKNPKNLPQFIPEKDFDFLSEIFTDDFSGIRDRLIIEILYLTGLRRIEIVNLSEKNINLNKKFIKVLGKRKKERIIPINDYLISLILKYQKIKTEKAFSNKTAFFLTNKGNPIYESFVYRTVKKYLSKITTVKKKSPHILRHTFATHLLNNGADLNAIKELLGHANLSATQIYTHNSFEKLNKIYKQAHPRA